MKHILRTAALTVAMILALSGCAGPSGEPSDAAPMATPTAKAPTVDTSPSSDPETQKPSLRPNPDATSLVGTLGMAEVEGGCPHLATSDGTRYEVIYPDGWELDRSPLQLVSPDGEVVARSGDEVEVRGDLAGDMASICQIGPIFRASEVVVP